MRTYRDYCRDARPVERTDKQPGDRVLSLGEVKVVPGEATVVAMRGRKGRGA